MKVKTWISYYVADAGDNGAIYPRSHYSKYDERFSDKSLKPEEVYSYDQAVDHAQEINETIYEGKMLHADNPVVVKRKSTTVVDIPTSGCKKEDRLILARTCMYGGRQCRVYIDSDFKETTDRCFAVRIMTVEQAEEVLSRISSDSRDLYKIVKI